MIKIQVDLLAPTFQAQTLLGTATQDGDSGTQVLAHEEPTEDEKQFEDGTGDGYTCSCRDGLYFIWFGVAPCKADVDNIVPICNQK